jgi:hypothetical protein
VFKELKLPQDRGVFEVELHVNYIVAVSNLLSLKEGITSDWSLL